MTDTTLTEEWTTRSHTEELHEELTALSHAVVQLAAWWDRHPQHELAPPRLAPYRYVFTTTPEEFEQAVTDLLDGADTSTVRVPHTEAHNLTEHHAMVERTFGGALTVAVTLLREHVPSEYPGPEYACMVHDTAVAARGGA